MGLEHGKGFSRSRWECVECVDVSWVRDKLVAVVNKVMNVWF
jgi:hypothetical protein